ncbi:M56 family metallopeptidase [Clostridium novyi]|uniref:M56 family metallopeptidase n=1 Tax=Clostridium novyi TaxID=1542 RepID=UPI0006916426|nr:M56 family metallopeptidase [Clostridium novyi]
MMFLPLFKFILYSTVLGSIISIVILLLRLVLKEKLGSRITYCIWLILIIKLIVPYGPGSSLSIFNIINFNNTDTVSLNYISSLNSSYDTKVNIKDNKDNTENKKVYKTSNSIKVKSDNNKVLKQTNNADTKSLAFVQKSYDDLIIKIVYSIWLLGVAILVTFTIIKTLKFHMDLKKQKLCSDEKILQLVSNCKKDMSIKSKMLIISNKNSNFPAIFGFINPRLILPKKICDEVNYDELRYIILHEMAHLKRKDTIVGCIISILQILHWFNPILWYSFYKMRQDREIACDAFALSYIDSNDYTKYGYTIIKLLENNKRCNGVYAVQCIVNDKHGLKRRITMISLFKKNSYKWSVIAIVFLMGVGAVTLTNPKKNIVVTSNKQSNKLDNINKITEYDIKTNRFKGKMLIVPNSKKIVVGVNKEYTSKVSKTTSEIAKENNALCAINAGGFTSDASGKSAEIVLKPDSGYETRKPCGILIHNGEIIYNNDEGRKSENISIVGFNKRGKLIVGKYTLEDLKNINIKEAVSFGPALIVDGNPANILGDGGWGVAPRTAIGQRKDGSVLFLVIDGRGFESMGATIKDVQDIMKKYGAVNASNLDGGTASTMYYKDKVINKPCADKEKAVASTFMVLK